MLLFEKAVITKSALVSVRILVYFSAFFSVVAAPMYGLLPTGYSMLVFVVSGLSQAFIVLESMFIVGKEAGRKVVGKDS